MRDKDGISYARKAMIPCDLAFNMNGRWEKCQLSPEMETIIAKRHAYFDNPD